MSKFKIGDRVVFIPGPLLGPPSDNTDMRQIARRGGEHVIAGFHSAYTNWVRLEGHRWVWNEEWFEPAYEFDSL